MPACIDIVGRNIAESFVIASIVVVIDESFNRFLQFTWHLMGHEVNLPLNSAVVSFYFTVGLGVIREATMCLMPTSLRYSPVLLPTSPSNARNQTIFMLLLDTGLRIGELVNLKVADVHMNEGFLKVLGKGKKERIVPMGSNAQRALQRYLFRYRPEPAHQGIDNVFLSIDGKTITENSTKLILARVAKKSGVTRLHAHLCRHTFATRFLINGGDVFTLQRILGHSTLAMVGHYIDLASDHVAIQHRRFSPLDRLNLRRI